jgi:hypothetical protein
MLFEGDRPVAAKPTLAIVRIRPDKQALRFTPAGFSRL